MRLFVRAVLIAFVTFSCGVKGAARPARPGLPLPVTVPGGGQ